MSGGSLGTSPEFSSSSEDNTWQSSEHLGSGSLGEPGDQAQTPRHSLHSNPELYEARSPFTKATLILSMQTTFTWGSSSPVLYHRVYSFVLYRLQTYMPVVSLIRSTVSSSEED